MFVADVQVLVDGKWWVVYRKQGAQRWLRATTREMAKGEAWKAMNIAKTALKPKGFEVSMRPA